MVEPWEAEVAERWTLAKLQAVFPEATIEVVGDWHELVVYTGWACEVYDEERDTWTDTIGGRLVPMGDD